MCSLMERISVNLDPGFKQFVARSSMLNIYIKRSVCNPYNLFKMSVWQSFLFKQMYLLIYFSSSLLSTNERSFEEKEVLSV